MAGSVWRGRPEYAVHLCLPLPGAQRAGSSKPPEGREAGSFSLSELPREGGSWGEKLPLPGTLSQGPGSVVRLLAHGRPRDDQGLHWSSWVGP